MNFELDETDKLFQYSVRSFCNDKLKEIIDKADMDKEKHIPKEALHLMAQNKLLGITIPEKYGGSGATLTQAVIAGIEIGRMDITMATSVFYLLEAGWGKIFAKYGKEEAKAEVLPKVVNGEYFLGVASTEPAGGSDLTDIKTIARKEGNEYVINGEKQYISGVREALELGGGHLTITCTDENKKSRGGYTLIYVPANAEGVEIKTIENMGRMGISTGSIVYRDVRINEKYVIREENKGYATLLEGFMKARALVSAACVGAAEEALEIGTNYIKNRMLFKKPLASYEGIQFELADMYAQLEMVKLMLYKGAWLLDRQEKDEEENKETVTVSDINKTIAMVKWKAPELAFDIFKKVMMWHGALAYSKDGGLEKGMRGITSYIMGAEGALNVMKFILSKEYLGKEYMQ
jgi:acyl-CoA dehydrogenase